MTSVTSICNRALQRLGTSTRIVNITDDTKNARACNACYEALRDAMLRKHYWNFAKKDTGALAPDDAAPGDPDFGYQFSLPSDFLRLVKPKNQPNLDWTIQARKLLTNDGDTIYVKYIAKITDANLFDPLFAEALAMDMAHAMCEEITQSTSKQESIRVDKKDIMDEAKRVNAFEIPPVESPDGSWITGRA